MKDFTLRSAMAMTFDKLHSKLLQTSYLLKVFWYSLSKIGPRGKILLFNRDLIIKVCFGLDLVTLVKGHFTTICINYRLLVKSEQKQGWVKGKDIMVPIS